jgi:hypothetical protein
VGAGVILATVDRSEVRRVARDVFSSGDYDRPLSWWERFMRWLARNLHLGPQGGAGAASGLSTLVLYVFLFAVAAVVVGLVVVLVRRWVPRVRKESEPDEPVEIDAHRTVGEWRADAEAAEAQGRWKDAIRARFRELVGRLVELGLVDPSPGRTTGELRADVDERLPEASAAFDRAALAFELPWYADVPCGPEVLGALLAAAAEVLHRTEVLV